MSKPLITNSNNRKKLPFISTCALMIITAVISACLAVNLLTSYRISLYNGRFVPTDYASLYVGLLNSVAFGLELFAALFLLLRKYVNLAEIFVALVLACGLAAVWTFTYYHSPFVYLYHGVLLLPSLFAALPMAVFPIATLSLIRSNRRKLKQANIKRWTALPLILSGALMILASLPFAYNSLSLLSYLVSIIPKSTTFGTYFPNAVLVVVLNFLFFGINLIAAVFLLKKKRVRLAMVIVAVALAIGLPLQIIANEPLPSPGLPFDFPTIACSFATLILVGLNYEYSKNDVIVNSTNNSAPEGKARKRRLLFN